MTESLRDTPIPDRELLAGAKQQFHDRMVANPAFEQVMRRRLFGTDDSPEGNLGDFHFEPFQKKIIGCSQFGVCYWRGDVAPGDTIEFNYLHMGNVWFSQQRIVASADFVAELAECLPSDVAPEAAAYSTSLECLNATEELAATEDLDLVLSGNTYCFGLRRDEQYAEIVAQYQ